MGFLRWLAHWLSAPPPPPKREPTIAHDYPRKWAEIEWRRTIHFLAQGFTGAAALLLALELLQLVLPVPFFAPSTRQRWIIGMVLLGAMSLIGMIFSCWFLCPRCRKTFRWPMETTGFLHDCDARCQHCFLEMGKPDENDDDAIK